MYLSRDPRPRFTFPLFVASPLYPPLDFSRTFARALIKTGATILFTLLTLYTRAYFFYFGESSPRQSKRTRLFFDKQTRRLCLLIIVGSSRPRRLSRVTKPRIIFRFEPCNYNPDRKDTTTCFSFVPCHGHLD